MPLTRPTLQQIIDRVEGDLIGATPVTQILRRSFMKVLARTIAGVSHVIHGFLQFIALQVFPDTAEAENLDRWAAIWGVQRAAASFTELSAKFTGTDTTPIPINTVVQRSDGVQYLTTVADTVGSITPGEVDIQIKAVLAGSDSNSDDATLLSLVSPIASVSSTVTVNTPGTVIEGGNAETDAQLLARLLLRIQQPPNGGAAQDYVQEALAVVSVTRAWVFPLNRGVGTVDVSFVEDGEIPIIPAAPKIAEVQAAIDAFKPVTADSIVFAPVAVTIDPTIKLEPNTAAVQAAAQAQLEQMLLEDAQVGGSFLSPAGVNSGTILISRMNEAVSLAVGETDHEFTSPVANFTVASGEIATLGTVTWLSF